jgi:hypothetical protein
MSQAIDQPIRLEDGYRALAEIIDLSEGEDGAEPGAEPGGGSADENFTPVAPPQGPGAVMMDDPGGNGGS